MLVYLTGQKRLPAKTRAFVNFIIDGFRTRKLQRVILAPRTTTGKGAP
ncbi:hypothetical protein [Neorhizobium lilium]|nr:hypothetical protein [Neorhizobium lilium]